MAAAPTGVLTVAGVRWEDAHWVQSDMIRTNQVGELLKGLGEVTVMGSEYGRLNGT